MDSRIFVQQIGQCESQDEYEKLVRDHEALYTGWRERIQPLLQEKGLNAAQAASGLHVSQSCAKQLFRKIPAKRENVIMLAMMLRLSVEETNELLTRWAKFQRLYPKHPEDFIWIYLLEGGGSDRPYELFQAYYRRYEALYKHYLKDKKRRSQEEAMETKVAFAFIQGNAGEGPAPSQESADRDERFERLVLRLLPSLDESYRKLMEYIDALFSDNDHSESGSRHSTRG